MRRLTNEEFLQKLKDKNIEYVPLNEYKNMVTKIQWLCLKNNKHIFEATPYEILKGNGCPYCSHHKVFVGETDMWTTNPYMASLLLNAEDGYKFTSHSTHKLDWVCPCCKTIIRNVSADNVNSKGLPCPICSDNRSYPEKFVFEMLQQLKVSFKHDRPTKWSDKKRYDFYVEESNLIIETHGKQHYEDSYLNGQIVSAETQKKNDKYKKYLAINNGIKYYIELDCRESNVYYIKNSILNSELSSIFDLSIVDWNKCSFVGCDSKDNTVLKLWNDGYKNTSDICRITLLNKTTVVSILKRYAEIGFCDYYSNYSKKEEKSTKISTLCELWNNKTKNIDELAKYIGVNRRYVLTLLQECADLGLCDYISKKNKTKYIQCVETGKIYYANNTNTINGFPKRGILRSCNGVRETAYGYHWRFVESN